MFKMGILPPGFPLVEGNWGIPLPEKFACPPMSPLHYFDPEIPILYFSCSFWPISPNCPPPVDLIWEILVTKVDLILLQYLWKY